MRTGTLAFLLGVVAVQFFSTLPDIRLVMLSFVIVMVFTMLTARFHRLGRWSYLPLLLSAGLTWGMLHAYWGLESRLPAELEGKDIMVSGVVSDLPTHGSRISRFNFRVDSVNSGTSWQETDWLLRLKWYGRQRPTIRAGQRWQFTVRLKRPHGFMNPGTLDYEKWLFSRGISASGYVRDRNTYTLIANVAGVAFWQRWREQLTQGLVSALNGHNMTAIVRALAVGDRSGMGREHWEVLTRTGTSHLVAISGLHLGLVAGFVFWLGLVVIKRFPLLCLYQPARVYAALLAMLAAVLYAALAGFSIPTQRALVMLSVVMLGMILRRQSAPLDTLCVAMLSVLLFDPFAVLSSGFWLSFMAVGVILFALAGRLTTTAFYMQWGRVQWAISLGLLPLVIIFFGRVSLIAPLVNIFAVPWVSFISLPLVMLSVAVLPFDIHWLPGIAADSLQLMWYVLEAVASLPVASSSVAATPVWLYLLAFTGIFWLLLPRGIPMKWAGFICLLPLFYARPQMPDKNSFTINVLDVGQGLSVVVQTANHVLVYDTGARYSRQFDLGDAVVLPVLRYHGIRHVDTLMVSHGDNDHSGGTYSVTAGVAVSRILSGEPGDLVLHPLSVPAGHCYAGQQWQWDGVDFEVLYPAPDARPASSTNNRSCVLRISNKHKTALLTGDIEATVERRLLAEVRAKLAADILIVPHHGSNSSSSRRFIQAVNPQHAVYSTGYRNRYGFPRPAVRRRYRQQGSQQHQTDKTGMLRLSVPQTGDILVMKWRQRQQRYWHAE